MCVHTRGCIRKFNFLVNVLLLLLVLLVLILVLLFVLVCVRAVRIRCVLFRMCCVCVLLIL